MLFSLHMMGAAAFNSKILLLTESEANQLGDAILRVTELYDITLMDEKTLAWGELFIVASGIYGTRVAAVLLTNKGKNKGPQIVPPAKVASTDFPNLREDAIDDKIIM